ncbi:chemotaxis protein CheX [[Clostridium] fimetarium]|uniref:Chemotaxis protein CheX n=1 Tax=[Clostridium] fimetarium TaxID=99656 RepID=A0A1I0M3Q0_9FIRM|nr:chemotaxis protein CheX [[Clostridium] fimetarium]SEV82420.1 chemotaxis protein CheX [[Clostridium] fimetarium]
MTDINVEFINPFLIATVGILKDMCQIALKVEKPYIKNTEFADDSILIMIGVTGEMRGQIIIALTISNACDVASKMMMGMPVTELNDLSISAISELGNMIMGNTATILSTKGIGIDITPPTICRGNLSFTTSYAKNICIPFSYENKVIMELDIAVKGES